MQLPDLLIVLGAYALAGTHLFIMTRWLRGENKSAAAQPSSHDVGPAGAGLPGRSFVRP